MKTFHKLFGNVTIAGFRKILAGEFLDVDKLPRGSKVYLRFKGRDYKPAEIRIEDKNVYVIAGDEKE